MKKNILVVLVLAVLITPLLSAQTIRSTRLSQIQFTELTTAQEAGMTLAEGSFWYNSDLKCYRYRSATSTYCIAGEEANPGLWNNIRVVDGNKHIDIAAAKTALGSSPGMILLPPGTYSLSGVLTLSSRQVLWGPAALVQVAYTSGDAIVLTGERASVNLRALDYTGGAGTTNGIVFRASTGNSEGAQVEIGRIHSFPGTGALFEATGSSGAVLDNTLRFGAIWRCGGGLLFKSNTLGTSGVEGNTVFGGLVTESTDFDIRFGDDAGDDNAQVNRFYGTSHNTTDPGNPAVEFFNSRNLFVGDLFRDTGTPKVQFTGGSGNGVISATLDSSYGGAALTSNFILSNTDIALKDFFIVQEGGTILFRDKSSGGDWFFRYDPSTRKVTIKSGESAQTTALLIEGGIDSDGSGLKHARFASGTTGTSIHDWVSTTWTFATAFANTNYTVACTIGNPTGFPIVAHTTNKQVGSIDIVIMAGSAAAASGTLNCIAVHD